MVTLRLLGAVMLAMGILISAIIEHAITSLYRQTMLAIVPVMAALAYVYYDSLDRMWAVMLALVAAGWLGTLVCLRQDAAEAARRQGTNVAGGDRQ